MSARAGPAPLPLDALFRGFADPTRLRLLNALVPGPLCVSDMVQVLGLPQPLVSRHLSYLRRVGLVRVERETRFAHYRLAEPTTPVHASLIACVQSCFSGIESLDEERRRAGALGTARREGCTPEVAAVTGG